MSILLYSGCEGQITVSFIPNSSDEEEMYLKFVFMKIYLSSFIHNKTELGWWHCRIWTDSVAAWEFYVSSDEVNIFYKQGEHIIFLPEDWLIVLK